MRLAKLGHHNCEYPEPIVTKYGMGDYVSDITPQAKIQSDHHSGGFQVNR